MRFASAFLSYSHADDKALVLQVAEALGRRGIIAWRDEAYIQAGENLDQALPRAVRDQVVFVPFIGPRSLASSWCQLELKVALKVERSLKADDTWITPVLLGDPVELWRASKGALDDWMTPDHRRMRKVFVDGSTAPDPDQIADAIAGVVYRRLGCRDADDIAIVIDQRGQGEPTGHPGHALVPRSALAQDWPALTFRPSTQPRTDKALVEGEAWERVARALRWALAEALPATRARANLWFYGDGQLALFYLLGMSRDSSTGATLYCTRAEAARGDRTLTNQEWSRESKAGTQRALRTLVSSGADLLRAKEDYPSVSLRIMLARDARLTDSQEHSEAAHGEREPLLTMEHVATLTQVNLTALVDRVEALAYLLRRDHRTAVIHLYTTLPAQVLPLLAWRLNAPGQPEVVFMEYRHQPSARPERLYASLRLKAAEASAPAPIAPVTAPAAARVVASPPPYARLVRFLQQRFEPDQLRALARKLGCADVLLPTLKTGPMSPEAAADDLLSALQRVTGGIPEDLFDRLIEERPRLTEEVVGIREQLAAEMVHS